MNEDGAPQPTWRKPAGMGFILLLLLGWSVAIVTAVEVLRLPSWASPIAFVAGGIAWLWIFPMKKLLRWMETGRWRA